MLVCEAGSVGERGDGHLLLHGGPRGEAVARDPVEADRVPHAQRVHQRPVKVKHHHARHPRGVFLCLRVRRCCRHPWGCTRVPSVYL